MNAPSAYDTIIIGGGPGGSTTGAFLARTGQRVLLLEREVFPRFHIGESLLPFGNAAHGYMGVYREMILMYYDNRSFEVLMHPRGRFGIVPAVNSILAGNFHRTFNVWWRVRLFHLVCAIHRRVPIVPRLDYSET